MEKNARPVWHTPQLLHRMGDNDDKRRLRAAAKSAGKQRDDAENL